MKSFVIVSLLILAIIAIVVFAPFATIFALNTLFGLGIAYTFWTWLSVIILNVLVLGGLKGGKWSSK